MSDPLELGREVIDREVRTLEALRDRLDESFARAVEILEKAEGRVVVTGVGKSGLVGMKIAATLTSTGTPSSFLHPTEAVHGDLGVVRSTDVVIALSKSGRSQEILYILPYFKRAGAPIIAVAESAESPLGKEADVVLELGRIEEACSLDLVPTSSTTATMALGDALAVALLRRRGFTEEDFVFFHPGGVIGRRVARRVGDLMHSGEKLPVASDTVNLREALVKIVEKGLGMTVLVDGAGDLTGVLTDGDLKRILLGPVGDDAMSRPVTEFMSRCPRTITAEKLIGTAVRVMEERSPGPVTSLVVVEGSRPVGILHLHDCLRAESAHTD